MRTKCLILAKSYKRRRDGKSGGRCVAGIVRDEHNGFRWVRLVADRFGESILDSEFPFNPIDVIEVDLTPCPQKNHIENCTYEFPRKITTASTKQLKNIFDKLPHSFFGSMSNHFEGSPTNSLSILFAKDLRIYWRVENGNKPKVDFRMGNNEATRVAVTDPNYYVDPGNHEMRIPLAICVVSLPIDGPYYTKFVASIFPIE